MPQPPAIALAPYGPAMSALNPQQQAFVLAFFECQDATNAARAAGYKDSGKTGIKVQGHRLIHNPKVRDAIVEHGKVRNVALVPKALAAREEIVGDKAHKDRARVADVILASAGMGAVVEHRVEHVMTVSDKLARLIELGEKPEDILRNLPADERAQVLELVRKKDGSFG